MAKKLYILLILLFGLAITPNYTFACGSNSAKSCCATKKSSKGINKKLCCSNKVADVAKEKPCCNKINKKSTDSATCKGKCGGSCGGKCGNKSCKCSVINLVAAYFKESATNFNKISLRQQVFPPIESDLSSGFYSIWTPPNIA